MKELRLSPKEAGKQLEKHLAPAQDATAGTTAMEQIVHAFVSCAKRGCTPHDCRCALVLL